MLEAWFGKFTGDTKTGDIVSSGEGYLQLQWNLDQLGL